MHILAPEQLLLIRHNLQTSCRLLNPAPEAREAFRKGLLSLLLQTGRMKAEQEAFGYLAGIFRHTCLASGYEAPRHNSSPVCYAHVRGLRPGFEDMDLSGQLEAAQPGEKAPLPAGFLAPDAGMPEALAAARGSVWQILNPGKAGIPADPALERKVAILVGRLLGSQEENNLGPAGRSAMD